MNNQRGSILIVTTGFVLVFTLLGIASLHFAGLQNELAEKRRFSLEAFWLADGALEIAKEKLPDLIDVEIQLDDDSRSYDVQSALVPGFADRWLVESTGYVLGEQRSIEAELRLAGIPPDAITSKEPLEPPDDIDIDPELIGEDPDLNFINLFNTTQEEVVEHIDEGGVIFTEIVSDSAEITFDYTEGRYLVLIDASQANALGITPDVEIVSLDVDGTTIHAILWIEGNINLINPDIEGTVFINGTPQLSGEGSINFSQDVVDTVVSNLGLNVTGNLKIISWKEI